MQYGFFQVLRQVELAPEHFVIWGRLTPPPHQPILPGSFLHLKVDPPGDYRMLWRPYSFLDYQPDTHQAAIYYRVVGEGTGQLCQRREGELLPAIYPLGTPFTHEGVSRAIMVAGGVGVAPLLMLYDRMRHSSPQLRVEFLFGARSGRDLVPGLLEEFGVVARMASEDGTLGHRGYITDLLPEVLEQGEWQMVYACGPNPMLSALADLLPEGLPCQVSLELPMACAIGVCNGCNLPLRSDGGRYPRRLCVEGPVMDLREVDFAALV